MNSIKVTAETLDNRMVIEIENNYTFVVRNKQLFVFDGNANVSWTDDNVFAANGFDIRLIIEIEHTDAMIAIVRYKQLVIQYCNAEWTVELAILISFGSERFDQ